MKMVPVVFNWTQVHLDDGEVVFAMVPQERYRKVAGRQFTDGDDYPMIVLEARSRASHNAYFAEVKRGFDNLPEDIAARFPSPEHLRKWVLVKTGWCSERESDWDSKRDAMRYVAFVREVVDEYASISIHEYGNRVKVIVRHAKSQSASAMSKQVFEDSKRAVLDMIAGMIGVKSSELKREARKSA